MHVAHTGAGRRQTYDPDGLYENNGAPRLEREGAGNWTGHQAPG
jgi:hypothetical protein